MCVLLNVKLVVHTVTTGL